MSFENNKTDKLDIQCGIPQCGIPQGSTNVLVSTMFADDTKLFYA